MKIPLSWLAEHISLDAKISNEDIEAAFVRVGFEVEEVSIQGADIKGPLLVAEVKSIEELSEEKQEEIRKNIPLQRFCSPDEIAKAVAFLASESAAYITGAVIPVTRVS